MDCDGPEYVVQMRTQLNFAESGSAFCIPEDVDMEAVKTLVLQRVEGLSCLCDTVW